MDLIPGLGRYPGEGNGKPLQYSCLENSMDRGVCQAVGSVCGISLWDHKELDIAFIYMYIFGHAAVPSPVIEPMAPVVEVWQPNHWIACQGIPYN